LKQKDRVMHVAIVIANGMKSFKHVVSVEEQEATFQEVGVTIGTWVSDAGRECTIFIPQVKKEAPVVQTTYENGRELTNELKKLRKSMEGEPFVLIVVGHGASAGYIDLIDKPLDAAVLQPRQYQIAADDINVIKPSWYFGLHCYAGDLIKGIDLGIPCFGIVGSETAGSNNLYDLVRTDSNGKALSKFLSKVSNNHHVEAYAEIKPWLSVNQQKAFLR
jgi:hypothetical protein